MEYQFYRPVTFARLFLQVSSASHDLEAFGLKLQLQRHRDCFTQMSVSSFEPWTQPWAWPGPSNVASRSECVFLATYWHTARAGMFSTCHVSFSHWSLHWPALAVRDIPFKCGYGVNRCNGVNRCSNMDALPPITDMHVSQLWFRVGARLPAIVRSLFFKTLVDDWMLYRSDDEPGPEHVPPKHRPATIRRVTRRTRVMKKLLKAHLRLKGFFEHCSFCYLWFDIVFLVRVPESRDQLLGESTRWHWSTFTRRATCFKIFETMKS